ncbi:MAG: hypothetical protein SGPRY_000741, partial [Prymnesium sp.]
SGGEGSPGRLQEGPGQEFEPDNTAAIQKVLGEDIARSCGVSHRPGAVGEKISPSTSKPEHLPATATTRRLLRCPEGKVLPMKTTAALYRYKGKMQDPEHVANFCRMEERAPSRGWKGAMLVKKKGLIDKGKACLEKLPTMSYKMNVVMMDENADVTFGNKDYPASFQKRIRARICSSFLEMGQHGLAVDPELYNLVRTRLADTLLCGKHAETWEKDMPPPAMKKQSRSRSAQSDMHEIDAILAKEEETKTHWQRYLVRWAGYQPEWEAWRIPGRGSPGDPLETWEPLSMDVEQNNEQLSNNKRSCPGCGSMLKYNIGQSLYQLVCDAAHKGVKDIRSAGRFKCFDCGSCAMSLPEDSLQLTVQVTIKLRAEGGAVDSEETLGLGHIYRVRRRRAASCGPTRLRDYTLRSCVSKEKYDMLPCELLDAKAAMLRSTQSRGRH